MLKPYLEESDIGGNEMTVVMTYQQMSDIADSLMVAGNKELSMLFYRMIDTYQDGVYFSNY